MCSVVQLCLTLCDPIDYSVPGSSVHGIPQVRIPEWVAISSSRGSPPGISPQRSNQCLLRLLQWQVNSLPLIMSLKILLPFLSGSNSLSYNIVRAELNSTNDFYVTSTSTRPLANSELFHFSIYPNKISHILYFLKISHSFLPTSLSVDDFYISLKRKEIETKRYCLLHFPLPLFY